MVALCLFAVPCQMSAQTPATEPAPRRPAATALQSTRSPTWEFEIHGGISGTRLVGGSSQLPAPGPALTYFGSPSRRVSSWYFGDGARLLNQSAATLGTPERISTLDFVLSGMAVKGAGGAEAGFRISRALTSRFAIELNLDFVHGSRMTRLAVESVEAARRSFEAVWIDIWPASSAALTDVEVTSTSEVADGGGRRVLATGAVVVDAGRRGRARPYLTLGAGLGVEAFEGASVRLAGRYRFSARLPPAITLGAFDESDMVVVRYESRRSTFPVGVFGGGVKVGGGSRPGLRIDLRVLVSPGTTDTFLDATPVRLSGQPEFDLVRGDGLGPYNLVFSNHSGARSSLSGEPLVGFRPQTSTATEVQMLLTIGIFFAGR